MMLLLLPVVLPVGLVVAWAVLLRLRGVPGWLFFASGAGLALLSLAVGDILGDAEDQNTPPGCQTGAEGGLECGFGIGRAAGVLGAVTATACLVFLAVLSLLLWHRNRTSARDRDALTD
ncbi:hypothetical protein [Micromonospora vulcania]|uniref:Uncharacterized protein n=1 Tax=Micromonospora vulcania TaxID=1441873 RepID=A0ABW1HBA0_9ACTN